MAENITNAVGYALVSSADGNFFCNEITEKLKKGFVLHGELKVVCVGKQLIFTQALVIGRV